MKKTILFSVLVFLLCAGCVSLMPKQFVEDNVFYCSYPEVKIKISPEFEYLGDVKYNKEGDSIDGTKQARYDMHSFIFVPKNTAKPYIKRVLQTQTERIKMHYISDIYRNVENKLEHGIQKLNGENYHFFIKAICPSKEKPVTKYMFEEGYILPACALIKVFSRVEGVDASFIISIIYLEDISDSEYPCSAWKDKDKLTEKQKQRIKDLGERFSGLFEVLK